MLKMKRLSVSLGLVASLLSLRCVPHAVFPAAASMVVLPLRDPLIRPDPSVLATLPGRDGPWSAWMFPDSGDWGGAMLPPAWAARLGPAFVDRGETQLRWYVYPTQDARAGLLSSLALGDLVVRDVPVKVTSLDFLLSPSGVLGQAILGHAPWEIDWDRGTLTLGATPWPYAPYAPYASDAPGAPGAPGAPDVIVVPLRRGRGLDFVTVQVDGYPVELMLDTGSESSTIRADIARDAGLSEHAVDRRKSPTGKLISGDTVLGPLRLGRIDFDSIPHDWAGHDRSAHGALGLDVLSRYLIQVIPGERLALRPRGDPWESAPQRIARWPWTRGCPSVGCLQARVEPVGNDARLVFSFEVDVPQPVELLLGCREADPVGSHLLTISELGTSGRSSAPAAHLSLRVASAQKDQALETVVLAGNRWLSRTRCHEVSVLDVVPIALKEIAGGAASASLEL